MTEVIMTEAEALLDSSVFDPENGSGKQIDDPEADGPGLSRPFEGPMW